MGDAGGDVIRAALLVAALASPAHGQAKCAARDEIGKQLARQYGEELRGQFLSPDGGGMVELFTAEGSWTMIYTEPSGKACLIGAGAWWKVTGVPRGTPG